MFNREAISMTAMRLGRTEAEIEAALKIEGEYRRDLARVKNRHRELAAADARDRHRRKCAAENPDWCLCDDFGLDHGQDPLRDEIVGYRTVRSWPYFNPDATHEETIYKCPLCGRKYVIKVWMA